MAFGRSKKWKMESGMYQKNDFFSYLKYGQALKPLASRPGDELICQMSFSFSLQAILSNFSLFPFTAKTWLINSKSQGGGRSETRPDWVIYLIQKDSFSPPRGNSIISLLRHFSLRGQIRGSLLEVIVISSLFYHTDKRERSYRRLRNEISY